MSFSWLQSVEVSRSTGRELKAIIAPAGWLEGWSHLYRVAKVQGWAAHHPISCTCWFKINEEGCSIHKSAARDGGRGPLDCYRYTLPNTEPSKAVNEFIANVSLCPLLQIKENVRTHRGRNASEADARQAGAVGEGKIPDAGNAIRNRDTPQASAVTEGNIPDAGNAVRNRDARQGGAVLVGIISDAANAIRNRDARQVGAGSEGAIPDAGDAIRKRDARQAGAAEEGSIPNACDTIRNRDAR